jgi:hypothetical protein
VGERGERGERGLVDRYAAGAWVMAAECCALTAWHMYVGLWEQLDLMLLGQQADVGVACMLCAALLALRAVQCCGSAVTHHGELGHSKAATWHPSPLHQPGAASSLAHGVTVAAQ